MDKFEMSLVAILVFIILSFGVLIYKDGDVKKKLILEVTGKSVPWSTAVFYPDSYFTNAKIKIDKESDR